MSGSQETKNEIRARLDELECLGKEFFWNTLTKYIEARKTKLQADLEAAPDAHQDDLIKSVLDGHSALCEAKRMGLKDAFGHDPAVFYGLALAGECGELSNALIKVLRHGGDAREKKEAVESELADVIIYAIVLAFTTGIDLPQIVNEKCQIVVKRALDGYYGDPLP